MSTTTALPGAETFFQFLQSRCPNQTLTVEGPKTYSFCVGPWFADMTYYTLFLDGQELGEYKVFPVKDENGNFTREYHGKIPGYVNDCVSEDEDPSFIVLLYDNEDYEAEINGPGQLVSTPWQRQDGHTEIVFP